MCSEFLPGLVSSSDHFGLSRDEQARETCECLESGRCDGSSEW